MIHTADLQAVRSIDDADADADALAKRLAAGEPYQGPRVGRPGNELRGSPGGGLERSLGRPAGSRILRRPFRP